MPHCLEIYSVHAGNPSDRVTFEERVPSLEEFKARRRNVVDNLGFPYLVAEEFLSGPEDMPVSRIVGYAYCSSFRSRAAYRRSAEVSIYIRQGSRGKGVGSTLMQNLLRRCRVESNLHSLISVMGTQQDNPSSFWLHKKYGFREVGVLREVGCKHGVFIDRLLMEKLLVADSHNTEDHRETTN